ncbi:hypothetical protein Xsto_00433 [Xenorhabdus stockiae]|uniref:Uncharacterized protein n=1 Tax=Xenorhabdus stockiae TaxID=351614 RepID=A0A2D0KUQ1_9GAMM|nr:hypothetical protein [Xenorhabdus stockiae]PHM67154.1 hypothetical protein Xsto_00433 [Xenorhabdus stockiae]
MKKRVTWLITVCFLSFNVMASDMPKLGKWDITKEVNKLTDKIDYFAVLSSENGEEALVLRCENNTTEA